jgi:CubicO group peptidase (beta-lactamase class C family)
MLSVLHHLCGSALMVRRNPGQTVTTLRRSASATLLALAIWPLTAASIPSGKPEEVGLSAERLHRIHEMVQRYIDADEMSGAVTLVARKGRIAHFEAQGLMNLASQRPMPRDGLFWVASMSKPVTAVAILILLEQGKIRLTDAVSKFIPEFRGMKVAVNQERPSGTSVPAAAPGAVSQFYTIPATREITIQDLLTHVSGLVSGGAVSTAEQTKIDVKAGEKLADYIPRLATTSLDFQPGSRWSYSPGAGFETLGRIVEIVSGQAFDQFLRQRIFEPLGMKDTAFHASPDRLSRVVTVYHRADSRLTPADDAADWYNNVASAFFSGAGGLMSDAEDYAQFGQMLLNGGELNGKRLLSPKTVELMSSVFVPDTTPGLRKGTGFGLGVRIVSDPVAAGFRVGAGSYGWDGYYGTYFWVDPKEKVVAILMIQTDNFNRQLERDFENAVMQSIVE